MTPTTHATDLMPLGDVDDATDQWLTALATHVDTDAHVLRLGETGLRAARDIEPVVTRDPDGSWRAGRYVGHLRYQDRDLVIEPRLGERALTDLLASALNLTVVPHAAAPTTSAIDLIAVLVDRVWTAALADAARHGGPRLRRTVTEDSDVLRGHLDVHATIAHRAAGRRLLTGVRATRDLTNPVTTTLVAADDTLRTLLPAGMATEWRPERARTTLTQLHRAAGHRATLPSLGELRRVRYTPITRPYAPLAAWSHEIASRRGHLTGAGGDGADGLLVDVAELWERHVLRAARAAYRDHLVLHGTTDTTSRHLLTAVDDPGRHHGLIKPDVMVTDQRGRVVAVLDAKYKWHHPTATRGAGVLDTDLYQLAAYLLAHPDADGALVYPPWPDTTDTAVTSRTWTTASGQHMRFLRLPTDPTAAAAHLEDVRSVGRGVPARH